MTTNTKEILKSDLIANRLDLKVLSANVINNVIQIYNKLESNPNVQHINVYILTTFGTVTGTIENPVTEGEAVEKTADGEYTVNFEKLFRDTRNKQVAEFEMENPKTRLVNDSAYLFVRDAVLIPFSKPESRHRFKELILFGDQISGITYGNPEYQ